MQNLTLFPKEIELPKPPQECNSPILWLRRVVILDKLAADSVIRDIEFHRGLNIIQTRHMLSKGPVAGHSVGKTLLLRLIRYTLGESHFGSVITHEGAVSVRPTAHVIAHWTLEDQDWIVVRPLNHSSAESYAVSGDNWKQAVDARGEKLAHRDFVQAVSDRVLRDLPTFNLPRGREAKWLDVLAWLARDYQCGYRKANDWRHEDANSGPCLDRDENSLIMQWLMGLMSPEEMELRLKHHGVLAERTDQKRSLDRDQKKIEMFWPLLRDKLELSDEVVINEDQATFDGTSLKDVVRNKIESLERLKVDRQQESAIAGLEFERDQLQNKLNDAELAVRECDAKIELRQREIMLIRSDPTRAYSRCKADPCWMKEAAKKTAHDPAAEQNVADLQDEIDQQREVRKGDDNRRDSFKASLEEVVAKLKTETNRLSGELSGIDEKIGRWKGIQEETRKYRALARLALNEASALEKADRAVNTSLAVQDDVRSRNQSETDRLSLVYQELLQQIFGSDAVGKVQIDGNGLQPVPGKWLAPGGAALSVMTAVLAFDIACVAAGLVGIGHHPRFLMHDSPREGDMEPPLFSRLFEVVHELELKAGGRERAGFQYIVTTTTEPPPTLSDPKGPYVRETLDRRDEAGLLLKRRF